MFRRTFNRLIMVFVDSPFSILFLLILGTATAYTGSYVIQCLVVDTPVRTIRLDVPSDAEVRAEASVVKNAFQIDVQADEWQTLYQNRQQGSHPIVVVRSNSIDSWLPRWGGVLHHTSVERPVFAGAYVEFFWKVGAVEKVSNNEYRVTASKEWAVTILFALFFLVSGFGSFAICFECRYAWSRSWNRSLHHFA